jgi:hypothetical protein
MHLPMRGKSAWESAPPERTPLEPRPARVRPPRSLPELPHGHPGGRTPLVSHGHPDPMAKEATGLPPDHWHGACSTGVHPTHTGSP